MTIALLLTAMAAVADISPRVFKNYTSADGLADNSAQTIMCTRTGRLVITTIGQINFYDGSKFSYIDPIDENVYALSEYRGNYHLYFDRYHHLWLKDRHSVTCVDLTVERFVSSIDEEFRKFGVKERVNDLFVDSAGVVWLLTEKGLHNVKTQLTIKPHERLNLQDLEVCKDKYVMLFYANGLMEMFDQTTGKKVSETRAYGDEDAERYGNSSLVRIADNGFYQMRNGQKEAILMYYDFGNDQWSEILRTPYHQNNMTLRDSMIYVPCKYGYWGINTNTMEMRHSEAVRLENGQTLETDINVIAFDRQGGMWAGTEKRGLLYSRPYRPPFNVYSWSDNQALVYGAMMDNVDQAPKFRGRTVNCVYKDSRGWTWVGTSQGLQLYRKEKDILPQVFTTKDGLYNSIVHSVVEDDLHNIWVTTSYGISLVLFKQGKVHYITSFNKYDNIPNEMFVNGKAMRLSDGRIVMQSLDHVLEFDPKALVMASGNYSFDIYPKLVRLMVNGNEVNTSTVIDGHKILDRALSRMYRLDLNYNQNSVTLVFSALNYFRPQQTFYRVRVNGLDNEWRVLTPYNSDGMVDGRGMLHLPLVALQPGEYEIEIQASMLPDKWDTRPYNWIVNINEPWWRTTGVFLGFILVLIVLGVINVFYYMKNANLKAQRNSEENMLIRRIYNFVERMESTTEVLEPAPEEYSVAQADSQNVLDPSFVKALMKIKPLVLQEKRQKKMTMRRLSSAAGIGGKEFYGLITANIFKSPRPLMKQNRLVEAEKMVRSSKATIEEIAQRCGFVSANYFIASFYQQYGATPQQYRRKR
ncbi:MAG: helix-turn-helix domain-containing protein [Prevotella sp.]|nr:helix-turn-helix domain-containing protein [Prevotella sp.]